MYTRSVPVTIAESYRKRNYPKHFYSKLTDSDSENSETQVWLDFALACKYVSLEIYNDLTSDGIEIGKLINYMLLNPEKFGSSKSD